MFGYGRGFDNGANVAKRMRAKHSETPKKTIHDADMVAHLWAHRAQSWSRNAKGSIFFDGDVIYSYGTHFPMACLLSTKIGDVVLMTSESASVTTRRHMASVHTAVRDKRIFSVPRVIARTPSDHEFNIAAMLALYRAAITNAQNRRRKDRMYWVGQAETIADNANAYKRIFFPKLRAPAIRHDTAFRVGIEAESVLQDARTDARVAGQNLDTPLLRTRRRRGYHTNRIRIRDRRNAYRRAIRAARKARKAGIGDRELLRLIPPLSDLRAILRRWRYARKAAKNVAASPSGYGHTGRAVTILEARRYNAERFGAVHFSPNQYQPRGFWYLEKFHRDLMTSAEFAARKAEHERAEAEYKARRQAEAEARKRAVADVIPMWRTGQISADARLRSVDCMLRISADGKHVETSWGANFPVADARQAWAIVGRIFAAGVAWHRNGEKIRIGSFNVDSISVCGTVVAGCHTLTKAEVMNCAALLNLSPVTVSSP